MTFVLPVLALADTMYVNVLVVVGADVVFESKASPSIGFGRAVQF